MVYYDDSGRRIRRHPQRRAPLAGSMPDDGTAQCILEVAERYPGFTPDEVRAMICRDLGRRDITREMVRAVLA